MTDLVSLYGRAADTFDARVAAIKDDQWDDPTPCAEWDVRTLVNHLVYESLWVPELLAGKTVEEVGDRYDGDQVGDDPVGAWRSSIAEARASVDGPGSLDRTVHLSWTDAPGSEYVKQLLTDLAIHGWDLARAIGADDTIDPDILDTVEQAVTASLDEIRASGMFGEVVEVPDDADRQTKLLALLGRRA